MNKKILTPTLLVLLAIGAYAVATYYFEVSVTGNIAMSIDEGSTTLAMDCGTLYEGETDVVCGELEIANNRNETMYVDITMDVGNLGCHLQSIPSYTNVAIPAQSSNYYTVLATVLPMTEAGEGTCTISVGPAA